MNTKIIILIGILLAVAIVGSLSFRQEETPSGQIEQNQELISLSPQTNSEGSVEVEVTPIDITGTSDLWLFKTVLNTHSVELDQDLTKLTVIKSNSGIEYKPLAWEGAPPGGHHREGILTFRPISPQPSTIDIIVKDIGGIPERKFSWKLQPA